MTDIPWGTERSGLYVNKESGGVPRNYWMLIAQQIDRHWHCRHRQGSAGGKEENDINGQNTTCILVKWALLFLFLFLSFSFFAEGQGKG